MRILHTADWHIGQLFHEYDRTFEHQEFLNWLQSILINEQIDVLLISGDIFDLSNPAASSIKMFYTFLNKAVNSNSELQIIITAGNHDSASRLESPKPLLESSNIHIIGVVEKDENGIIDYDKIIIPLKDKNGNVKTWCIAAPFLRTGDYPTILDCDNPYTEGVAAFYKESYEFVSSKRQTHQAIIAMGHLHAQQAEINTDDKERPIMGGVECISASAFNENICYVALGHIHKAQRIGGKDHIRYCGSPLPMSFSEINYRHQVIVFEIDEGQIYNLKTIEIPISIPLLSVPVVHSSLEEVLSALAQLNTAEDNLDLAPYLQVRVLLENPEPSLKYKVEAALKGKYVRLASIDTRYRTKSSELEKSENISQTQLNELKPEDVLRKIYQNKYNNPIPDNLLKLFQQVTQEVNEKE
ncbi:exonuclease subunit SbcD [Chryseobacterium sp. G0240]|uniref:exonuclease SbcCD subunit D n=1 Tax=Chryseobacterium sp. G0240 TaxID=2487066 RepID=UPI000F44D08C|nr:exonuclease SbcCD subunit D C-terminal domain-containing protein [Chryseobacterium sp. G0240]ROI03261.1 exonuclease subunit SbcD [Chryseobacterium sp. G0240]